MLKILLSVITTSCPKSPCGHPVLHRGLKLNSEISVGKYKKKVNPEGLTDFPSGS